RSDSTRASADVPERCIPRTTRALRAGRAFLAAVVIEGLAGSGGRGVCHTTAFPLFPRPLADLRTYPEDRGNLLRPDPGTAVRPAPAQGLRGPATEPSG